MKVASTPEAASTPAAATLGKAARQPHARWPYLWLVTGASLIAASLYWPPLPTGSSLVLLGQDEHFWSWLTPVSGVLATGVGLLGVAYFLGRNYDAWWQGALLTLFSSSIVLALCLLAIPAAIIGALIVTSSSYRDLGNAHNDGVVVALYPSNGYSDSELVFGTRHGIWVDFDATTRTTVDNDLDLTDWNFTLHTTATTGTAAEVRYSRTAGPPEPTTVTLTRTGS